MYSFFHVCLLISIHLGSSTNMSTRLFGEKTTRSIHFVKFQVEAEVVLPSSYCQQIVRCISVHKNGGLAGAERALKHDLAFGVNRLYRTMLVMG